MTKLLNAKEMEEWAEGIIQHVVSKSSKGRAPKLVIIVASDDKASQIYVNNKIKMGNKFGIDVHVEKFAVFATNEDIEAYIKELNNDNGVDGVILQLPVYEHLNPKYLINRLSHFKDVDGLTWYSKAMLEENRAEFNPCTPMGVISLLQIENVDIKGKNVVIVGKGETAGAPMATMFRNHEATVTICHASTPRKDLEFYIRHADIVVSCVGKRGLIKSDWFKEGSVAIGVGLSYDENGKQRLDFEVEEVVELGKASLVSKRTNCTGTSTVISLMCNTVTAYLREL